MMKIMNSDKEEMQKLCNFVRENVEKHDYEKCKEKIMRAMSEFPHAAEPHNLMGIVLEKEGNHVTAMRHFRAAWELDPAYLPTRENLEAFGAFPQNGRYVFDESDCKDVIKQGGERDDESCYDWNFTW